jgi:hypothetical protein
MRNYLNKNPKTWMHSVLCGLLVAGSASTAFGAPDKVLNTFDASIAGCGNAWGGAGAGSLFDPLQDNTGNGGGSLYITSDYATDQNTLTYFCNEPPNGAWYFPGPAFNLSDYASLEFDIKWDNTKTVSVADFNAPPLGGEGGIVIWATDSPGFSIRPTLGSVSVPAAAATGWAHVSLPINPAITGIDPSVGIVFKKWIAAAQQTAGGTFGFWVDNVVLKGTDAPPPPPTVSLGDVTPGLAFVSASGGQYDRQNIVTVGNGYSWIGATGPVSYSIDVEQLGDNAVPGYELHMFFVPGTPDTTRSDPDWHEPNVLRWDIGNNANGSAYSTIRYKTNTVDGNGIYYDAGQLGGPGSATSTGTWKITFNNDTNITATSPDGTVFATNLPPDVVAAYANPMLFYVGSVPGSMARIGQLAVVSRIKIEGTPGAPNLDSQFVGTPLNGADWATNAASPIGVQEIPLNAKYWLQWTLPASGYSPQFAASLSGPWSDPIVSSFGGGGMQRTLLLDSDLPGANMGFFRLIKRTFTKLQVLMPGETAAPGTPTGKTGTPTPQLVGVEFNVTVRSVDDDWYPVASGDTIDILTSTDPSVSVPPFVTPLVGGTVDIPVTFFTAGNQTITATDATDPTKTAGTSSPTSVVAP